MKKKLLIFPFNGNGIEALDCLSDQFDFIGFIDDTIEKHGNSNFLGIDVFNRDAINKYKDAFILAVPGSPASFLIRDNIINSLNVPIERFAQVIHPSAVVSKYASIGFNVLIMENVVIKAGASIGNHICILPNTAIHHDSKINDFSLIGANVTIAGFTTIGSQCYIGSGSSIINNISIGEKTIVGIGTNVIRSFESHSKLIGNPAKSI
jgi:sugar O-acyltransferase (sialic acid O-acetyltransferase NeuD family)